MLPDGYVMRPPTLDDLDATVELFNICAQDLLGVRKFSVSGIRSEWLTPGVDLQRDFRLVLTTQGEIVGYYEVWDLDAPHTRVDCWGRVHPQHCGKGIGSTLLAWVEERAQLALLKAPPEARVSLRAWVPSIQESALQLFQGMGYVVVRHNLRMVIDLDQQPLEMPVWPAGITVRPMKVGLEERAMLETVRDSFRDHWGYVMRPLDDELARWKHMIETDEECDPSMWFAALDGEQIIGTSLCYLKVDDDPEMGWVGTLGVRRPWRRQGIARALLLHSFQELYRRGQHKVGLGVDAQSLTGATRLYLKAGMHPDPKHQYTILEKELRSGVEFCTERLEGESYANAAV